MEDTRSVQWYPGHMASSRRKISEDLKLVDAVAELRDARVPQSSSNPVLETLCQKKPRVVLLGKMDLADPRATDQWVSFYEKKGICAVALNCRDGRGISAFLKAVRHVAREKLSFWEEKGMGDRPLRVMIVGIPNVGKSSLINRLAGSRGKAKVEDRPGVTRRNQWFAVEQGLELLDTPGILWPKFEDSLVGERLAFTGAVRDEVVDREWLACRLLEFLRDRYPQCINARYKLSVSQTEVRAGYELLELLGRKRGMVVSGGEVDTERAAGTLLNEFRGGLLGRITLEFPDE